MNSAVLAPFQGCSENQGLCDSNMPALSTLKISKCVRLVVLLCRVFGTGLGAVMLFVSSTRVVANSDGTNHGELSSDQSRRNAPPEMVWIASGTFMMGTNDERSFPNERPAHLVEVEGFWMDEHDVTNAEFAKFVEATGYVTTAERKPDWEELKKQLPPDTPKPDDSVLVPGSLVFTPTFGPVPLDNLSAWWRWVPGADWRHPEGPTSSIKGRENHPVVQVSWHDAVAYAKWAGKRLASEAEWNTPLAAALKVSGLPGATSFDRTASTWRIPGRDYFPSKTVEKMALSVLPPSAPSLQMATVCTTWPAMSGNGATTGIGVDTNLDAASKSVCRDPRGPAESYDPAEPYSPKRL
jgi:sulfatase modifying factor 1